MLEVVDGRLRLRDAAFDHRITLAWRNDAAWQPLTLRSAGDALVASDGPVKARLALEPGDGSIGFSLSFESTYPTRLQLAVTIPQSIDPFHLLPSFLFGDNNLAHVKENMAPSLTLAHPDRPSCSPYWECRADRASHPVSIAVWKGGLAAVSIQPYTDGVSPARAGSVEDQGFVRNGIFAQLAHDGKPAACGVTLGYANLPKTWKTMYEPLSPTAHLALRGEARGRIYLRRADDRRAAHAVVRDVYGAFREKPEPPISRERAARDLTDAFLRINWHDADGVNAIGTDPGAATPWFGGERFRENFTNMRCADEAKLTLKAWRTLAEVGWTGGSTIGYPILRAGARFGDKTAIARALYKIDLVADGFNPASGLLWDVSGAADHEGKRLNWWWSGDAYMDRHCAYTNGSAVYYSLKAHRFVREGGAGVSAPRADDWLRTSLKVLDTVVKLQHPDGNLGVLYSAERPEIVDAEGFAGAWFIPGLALAYGATRDAKYLDAARRALAFYHEDVQRLSCWGTPMDVGKMVDQEGNLGFLRGAILLHEVTGSREFLDAAVDSAHFEYLWRYGIRTRPQARPLRGSPWNSCGGSITSSATSMHPMGVYISDELRTLAGLTGDDYHAKRSDDGLNWAANNVALWPEHTGYGARGVMTERFCPSDGTLIETYPDGSPSSIWFSYNGWAAAASLEGLVECLAPAGDRSAEPTEAAAV